jgi:hypothetical protein
VDGPNADRAAVIAEANAFPGRIHSQKRREWAYIHVRPRLIAERRVAPRDDLIELKCFTYGPRVEFFLVLRRRPPGTGARYDRRADGSFALCPQPTSLGPEIDRAPLPPVTERALRVAEEIGAHFDHMRVDFLTDGEALYLGELTVYHSAGEVYLQGHDPEAPANRSWDIRNTWFLTTPQSGWRRLYAEALRRRLEADTGA